MTTEQTIAASKELAERHEARLSRVRLYAKALLKIMVASPPDTKAGYDDLARSFVTMVEIFEEEQMGGIRAEWKALETNARETSGDPQ